MEDSLRMWGVKDVRTSQRAPRLSQFSFLSASLILRGGCLAQLFLAKTLKERKKHIPFLGDQSSTDMTFSQLQTCISDSDGGGLRKRMWGGQLLSP